MSSSRCIAVPTLLPRLALIHWDFQSQAVVFLLPGAQSIPTSYQPFADYLPVTYLCFYPLLPEQHWTLTATLNIKNIVWSLSSLIPKQEKYLCCNHDLQHKVIKELLCNTNKWNNLFSTRPISNDRMRDKRMKVSMLASTSRMYYHCIKKDHYIGVYLACTSGGHLPQIWWVCLFSWTLFWLVCCVCILLSLSQITSGYDSNSKGNYLLRDQ